MFYDSLKFWADFFANLTLFLLFAVVTGLYLSTIFVVAGWVAFPYIKSHPSVLNKYLFEVLGLRATIFIVLPSTLHNPSHA
jgi:hypothetical protein